MASSVTMPRYFRFCPNCLKEDLQKYGEAYWHRLHQTPGALVCPVHAVALPDSVVPIQGFNQHEYQAASPENCLITPNQQIDNAFGDRNLLCSCVGMEAYTQG